MKEQSVLPYYLKKSDLPQDAPIRYEECVCREGYDPESSVSRTYAHEMLEVGIVTTGSGIHRVLNQSIPCESGDVYVVPAGISHGYFRTASSEALTVRKLYFDVRDWFSGDVVDRDHIRYAYGVFRDNAVTSYAMLNAQTAREVHGLCDAILRELSEKQPEWKDAVRADLRLLLITLGRYVSGAIKNESDAPKKERGMVSSVLQAVSERFSDPAFTLEAIAEEMYVSKSHLSRVFKRITGNSFSEYLRGIRMNHACMLLTESDLTVEEIVGRCGLRDVPSFYHSFHLYTEQTPSQFRSAYGRSQEENTNIHERKEKIMIILSEISANLQRGKAKIVKEMVQAAIDEGCDVEKILNEGLLDGMNVIGEKFKNNEVYVPEVLVAARAMNMGMQVLKPHLMASGVSATGRVCIGTVQGDLHDIGKNLVKMMMEGKGLEVIDLGTDVAPETFVQTAIEQDCQVICCSALLTTTMGVMEDVVKLAEEKGIRDRVKIMVGGAPVSEEFAKKIGADCYTSDAASAADAAVGFCKA